MQLYHHIICSTMNAAILALCFMCLLLENAAHPMAQAGERVSLECLCKHVEVMSYWYKQIPGRSPKLVCTFYKHNNNSVFEEEFNSSRFSLHPGSRKLKIEDVRRSDSATYYCATSNLNDFDICEGTTVRVEGSGFGIQTLVHQSGTIQPGGSKTLSCTVHTGTCDGVYWFNNMNESHPGLIQTHGGWNNGCEKNSDVRTHTCVYNLPMKTLSASRNGMLHCAVASCGRVLLGNRSEASEDEEVLPLSVYVLGGALAFTTILALLLAYLVYKLSRGNYLDAAASPSTQFSHDEEGLHYAAVRVHKANKARRQQHNTYGECVYSSMKL